jgi:hypothetical protein
VGKSIHLITGKQGVVRQDSPQGVAGVGLLRVAVPGTLGVWSHPREHRGRTKVRKAL